jgi:hypothetical protein
VATRRKYRQPQGYKDGGAVPVVDIVVEPMPVPAEQPAPLAHEHVEAAAAPLPPQSDDSDALVRAHAAHMRAEDLQRQAAQRRPTVEAHIDGIPGLSGHKRAFLKQHPHLLEGPNVDAVRFHYQSALSRGVPDDTESMNEAILAGLYREREHEAKNAPPPAEAPRIAPRTRSTSLPMSAPVSRDVPSYSSGKPVSNRMTLSPEERDIAHRSFVDRPDMPKLTNEQREYIYAQNKRKYLQAKADGSYSEQRGGNSVLRAAYRDDDR